MHKSAEMCLQLGVSNKASLTPLLKWGYGDIGTWPVMKEEGFHKVTAVENEK